MISPFMRVKSIGDNSFSTLDLIVLFKTIGILVTAAFRTSCLKGCPLPSDKGQKWRNEGWKMKVTDLMIVALTSVHYFMWTATRTLKRWITKEKSYIDISLPDTVLDYNRSVAGVYLADMLIALYRIKIIARKNWYLKVIFHTFNNC